MKWIRWPVAKIWAFEIFQDARSVIGRRSVVIHRVSKNKTQKLCPCLRLILIDFQNSFIVTFGRKYAIKRGRGRGPGERTGQKRKGRTKEKGEKGGRGKMIIWIYGLQILASPFETVGSLTTVLRYRRVCDHNKFMTAT